MLNVLAALRQHTGPLHETLHRHPLLQACLAYQLDKQNYGHLLHAFYAPWQALAPHIDNAALEALKRPLCLRLEALRKDLMCLDIKPQCQPATPAALFSGPDRCLGACYVLVGSSLGAATLQQGVKASCPGLPTHYLSVSPRDAGWPILAGHLKTLSAHRHPDVCTAALQAFELIRDQMTHNPK